MRGILGYIKNLADGLGPPPGSVTVNNKPTVDNVELDLTTHRLGAISRAHVNGGSGSSVLADSLGRFGWQVELSPGPMNIAVTPHDPQTEYRKRYPDESAQVGKAFMTDLERLGWAGGRDHLIWNAVFGGNNPTAAQWSTNPTLSYSMGNGSIAGFGSGGDAGRLTIRQFIAMLGGVPFSVEMGDLVIPVTGDSAISSNPAGTDRWDVICAAIDWNPASDTYGKQKFEVTQGTPGAGIPATIPNNTDNWRRLPLHAVKMAAGTGVYSAGYDLRHWANPPAGVTPGAIVASPIVIAAQILNVGDQASSLNTTLNSNQLTLSPACAWDGYATLRYRAVVLPTVTAASLYSVVSTTGVDPAVVDVTGTNYVVACLNESGNAYPRTLDPLGQTTGLIGQTFLYPITVTFPLTRIPAFDAGGGPSAASRSWSKLRFAITHSRGGGLVTLVDQSLTYHLWPVP